jgi:ABC-type transporter MlaC component
MMTMKRVQKILLSMLLLAGAMTLAAAAFAQGGAQAFLEAQHQKITTLLRQPASASRDSQVSAVLDRMVDYGELARRTFGQPCPDAVPSCTNHWSGLTDAQKTEVTSLLHQLVSKNYQKNLIKTLDYDIAYKGTQDQGGVSRVRTEATSRLKPRDPAIEVDYVIQGSVGSYHVVDIITEESSLTKNYYDQFHRMLTSPEQGYSYLVKKLTDKIAQLG